MARLTIPTETRIYRVSPDDPVTQAGRFRVLVAGKLVDELTKEPPQGRAKLVIQEQDLIARVSQHSLFTVAGTPIRCFPSLGTQSYDLHLTVAGPGYIPLEATTRIPQQLGFPVQLPPLVGLNLPVHREPVTIAGRVMENTSASSPVEGATVQIKGIWPTLPPPDVSPPDADKPNFVSLRAPLYSPRDLLTTQARAVTMTPTGAPDKVLNTPAAPEDKTVELDNCIGLNSGGGDLLWIDSSTDVEEFIATAKVLGASTLDQPGKAILAFGLRNVHHRGAGVKIVAPLAPGPGQSLTRSAIAGDVVLFFNDLSDWIGASAIEIDDGTTAEYHAISQFAAITDSQGFYRLPPISRVAMVALEAQGPTLGKVPLWSVDYSESINRVDFHL